MAGDLIPPQPRSFSGHVWDLNDQRLALEEIAGRSKYAINVMARLEVAWVLPRDAWAEGVRRPDADALGAPLLDQLLELPVVIGSGFDRPYLALRPSAPSAGTDRLIRNGIAQRMHEFDYGAAPSWIRDGMPLP